jgi:hypothetical protein
MKKTPRSSKRKLEVCQHHAPHSNDTFTDVILAMFGVERRYHCICCMSLTVLTVV